MKMMNTSVNQGRNVGNSNAAPPTDAQMELSFGTSRRNLGSGPRLAGSRRQRHLNRALWWFRQMRQVVDLATDWQPAPAPRPEQTWFTEAEPRVA